MKPHSCLPSSANETKLFVPKDGEKKGKRAGKDWRTDMNIYRGIERRRDADVMLMQCVFTKREKNLKSCWSRENKIIETGLKIRGNVELQQELLSD